MKMDWQKKDNCNSLIFKDVRYMEVRLGILLYFELKLQKRLLKSLSQKIIIIIGKIMKQQ